MIPLLRIILADPSPTPYSALSISSFFLADERRWIQMLKVFGYGFCLQVSAEGTLKRVFPCQYISSRIIYNWNRFAWATYPWSYSLGLMRGIFEKIERFKLFKQVNLESTKIHKYIIVDFMLPSKVSLKWNCIPE
ncbi:unnamed protein product [Lactuca saligna]|uniref:Uncharacterized protein n=1 Tax=Lactuca saligna TaxID=75948 RepID=A0AA35ZJJ2_LACSI|nr:unnamed protein product [Lactuca saligna]